MRHPRHDTRLHATRHLISLRAVESQMEGSDLHLSAVSQLGDIRARWTKGQVLACTEEGL